MSDNEFETIENNPSSPISNTPGDISDRGDISNSQKTLINFEDLSEDNLSRLPFDLNISDHVSAASYFLRDYITLLTIREQGKKTFTKKRAYYYREHIRLLSTRQIKLIDIDYTHFTDWVDQYYEKMMKICHKYKSEYPLVDINALDDLDKTDLCLYMYSKKLLEYLDKDRVEEFQKIMKQAALYVYISLYDNDLSLELDEKNKDWDLTKSFLALHIGIKNFPNERDIYQIKSEFINKAIVVKGDLVSYDDKARVEIVKSTWRCNSCQFAFAVWGSNKPVKCIGCGERGAFEDLNQYVNINYIYIKIQQHMNSQETQIGVTDLTVKLEGSYLIENFYKRMKPAANLKITGVVKLSQEKTNRNNPNERLLQLHALTIEIEGENTVIQYNDRLMDIIANKLNPAFQEEHFKKLERSICPHLYRREPQKTAILLQCVGATPRVDRISKHRIRGDINILFAGDPGVGKSEFGFFIEKILPMSIRTIGGKSTTTKAALTTSSDMINGVRIVTFGVLPRCDMRGIAIVDELDKRDTDDMQILSVPMDDNQVIPTHKSGFHHNVFARCPVLLLGNATKKHGKWDVTKTIDDQTNYARWLISRVDLVFVMVDEGDMQEKELMVKHMAKTRGNMVSETDYDKNYKNKLYSDISIEKVENDLVNNRFDGVYDTEYLRHEIHYLKQNYAPTIKPNSEAETLLRKEYLRFSQLTVLNDFGDGDGPVSQAVMDARAYNGLERIAMAVARCRRHHTVTVDDMDKALGLMLSSLTSMMPRPKKDTESLNNGDIYKRFLSNPDGIKKALEAANSGWEHKRDEIIKKYRNKLHRFNQILFKRGFFNCADCHGNGIITAETQSETCMTCKGNKVFNRKFTYLDFEADVINSKLMFQKEIKTWFSIYRANNIVKNVGGSTYMIGFTTIDNIAISDFVEQLAIASANEDIKNEKKRMEGGVDNIGPASILPSSGGDI